MIVKKFDKNVDEAAWSKFIATSKNSTFLFDRSFMDYHSHRFTDYSLLVYNDDKLIALLPANVIESEVVSHQGLTYGGLIMQHEIKLVQVIQVMHAVLKYLNSNGISFFRLKLIPSFYCKYATDDLEYVLFLLNAQLMRRDVALVIRYDKRINCSGNIRREAQKAQKIGAVIQYDDALDEFWTEVLSPNLLERFGVAPVHSLQEITYLKQNFPENIKQVNAYYEGEVVAGTTLFIDNGVVHCQYISATDKGRKLGCLNYLFVHVTDNYSKTELYFDFGIVNENNGKDLNTGMLFWKEGFGGRSLKHDFYSIKTNSYTSIENFL